MDDRLPDPPDGVADELGPPRRIEVPRRPEQPDVPLAHEIVERQAHAGVPPGRLDHEAEVGLDQTVVGGVVPRLALALAEGALLVPIEGGESADFEQVALQV